MERLPRRLAWTLALLAVGTAIACASTPSTLRSLGKPTGSGPARLEVSNHSGVSVQELYVAATEKVDRARAAGVAPGSPEDVELWGDDHLGRAGLADGQTAEIGELAAGRYDVLALDANRREQLVKGLRLQPGGRYALELYDNGWQLPR